MINTITCTLFFALLLSMALAPTSYAQSEATNTPVFTDNEVGRMVSFGPWPAVIPTDPGNEYSGLASAEHLGESLFNDVDLSGDATLSCASCHQKANGFTDQQPLAQGVQQHVRNTQGLLDVGMQRWFGWDGGSDSLWAASLRPMLSDIEMAGNIQTIASRLRSKPDIFNALKQSGQHNDALSLPDEELVVLIAKLIGAYMRTLSSGITAFDRFSQALANNDIDAQNQYSAAAQRGLKIFIGDANCHVCHFGANFSNGEFHDTGRPFFTDTGKVDPGRYAGIQRVRDDRYNLIGAFNGTVSDSAHGNLNGTKAADEMRKTTSVKLVQANFGQWRTPSLRNLSLTAPYMHDGSLSTLRDVVDAYADIDASRLHSQGESILKPLDLSDSQRNDLVEFLRSLTAE